MRSSSLEAIWQQSISIGSLSIVPDSCWEGIQGRSVLFSTCFSRQFRAAVVTARQIAKPQMPKRRVMVRLMQLIRTRVALKRVRKKSLVHLKRKSQVVGILYIIQVCPPQQTTYLHRNAKRLQCIDELPFIRVFVILHSTEFVSRVIHRHRSNPLLRVNAAFYCPFTPMPFTPSSSTSLPSSSSKPVSPPHPLTRSFISTLFSSCHLASAAVA